MKGFIIFFICLLPTGYMKVAVALNYMGLFKLHNVIKLVNIMSVAIRYDSLVL